MLTHHMAEDGIKPDVVYHTALTDEQCKVEYLND